MFHYFPDSSRSSHAMLLGLGAIPWGGNDIGEIDVVGQRLKEKVGDYDAWHTEWLAEKLGV